MFFQTDTHIVLLALSLREAGSMYDCVYSVHAFKLHQLYDPQYYMPQSDPELLSGILLSSSRNTTVNSYFIKGGCILCR